MGLWRRSQPEQLQWGRSIRAAESLAVDDLVEGVRDASMGPQHKSCGEYAVVQLVGRDTHGFNGAAA